MDDVLYFNLQEERAGKDIELLFPGWRGGDECLVVYSPHDDDALLGTGYLLSAALGLGASCYVFIFCNGCGGYSRAEQKETIVEIRREETARAYQRLGLEEGQILRFEYPDFGVLPFIGWQLPYGGQGGHMEKAIRTLRTIRATRLLIPNAHREHLDHEAVARMGLYDGPQAGDPILADLGHPAGVKTVMEYSVWSDFSPQEALVAGRDGEIRANRALRAGREMEEKIQSCIREYRSQAGIIQGLVEHREERRSQAGYIEVYLDRDPRPRLDYGPYRKIMERIAGP